MLTPHQAKYFAHELTKRCTSDSVEKFSATLLDAQVDLNPHQVEAALFAFKSPLSSGAILADEVGLGKTIEAGILLSQKWAEGNRHLLVISPSNLRKQWSQELEEKFYLPTQILEQKVFNKMIKAGKRNPFEQPKVVICSYHFAKSKADYVQLVDWGMVVIDEAHRLRNVHRPSNVIGRAIKDAVAHSRKVLLTATPLQNSLMELYGLVSLIDEQVFGDRLSFRAQFSRTGGEVDFEDLKDRLKPVCHRTLRRQVQEYIRYTNRIPLTFQFEPTDEEQELYEKINHYLQRELLFALPSSQRHLLTMIMRKLLASSTFAIAGTLNRLIVRLEKLVAEGKEQLQSLEAFEDELDDIEDYLDEWEYEEALEDRALEQEEIDKIAKELAELKQYCALAEGIQDNAKGDRLVVALREGFAKMQDLGAPEKAIVFTESRRTQNYLFELLQRTAFKGKVMLFNGANNDALSKQIYQTWLKANEGTDRVTGSKTADMRAALVEHFRDAGQILIATEAAAEGINLQFCAMVVNYDLPWNPQRIEQRIGRCHRYGQQYDVVVVNFLNLKNAADQRVYQLLDEKFELFSGVFGASDEVLGSIEHGVDFEKKIAEIYNSCRTTEEINASFDTLQQTLEAQISARMRSAREQLLEHFDAEVIDKLKVRMADAQSYIGRYEQWLWYIAQYALSNYAAFSSERFMFELRERPFGLEVPLGWYTLDKKGQAPHRLRIGHPLSQAIIQQAKADETPPVEIVFDYANAPGKTSILEPLAGQSGILCLELFTVSSFEVTDHLLFAALADGQAALSAEQCRRMMALPVRRWQATALSDTEQERLRQAVDEQAEVLLGSLKDKDTSFFRREVDKLQKWADDRVYTAEKAIRDTKTKIRDLERECRQEAEPKALIELQRKIGALKKKLRGQRNEIFRVEDEIEGQRDRTIAEMEGRMQRKTQVQPLFSIKWRVV